METDEQARKGSVNTFQRVKPHSFCNFLGSAEAGPVQNAVAIAFCSSYYVLPAMAFHSGFVCLLGRPNAGQSSLLTALVGERLAIISPTPQTTRNRILGIVHIPRQG